MRKGSVAVLFFTLAAGVAGFFLRRHEVATAFEPSGLARRGATVTMLLVALTVVFAAIIIIIGIYASRSFKAPASFEDTFSTGSLGYLLSFIAICLLWNCGTIFYLVSLLRANALQTYDIYFIILSILASLSVVFIAVDMYQDSYSKAPYALIIVPMVFLCYWLILLYRQNAANPVLLDFVYLCLAIAASILCFYYTAGFLYNKPSPGKAIVANGFTIYFCSVALADKLDIGTLLIIGAVLATAAVHLLTLLRGLVKNSAVPEGLNDGQAGRT